MTPERVSLGYDLAGIGSRAAAALIDVTIQGLVWLSLLIVLGVTFSRFPVDLDDARPVVLVVLLIVAFLGGFFLLWGYYMLFEIIWSGQTPGKRALGLRVIRENGYPIRPGDAVVRNLIRVIDGPPFGAAIGSLVMLLNSRSKRLGDYVAGTIVVREGKRLRLADVVGDAQSTGGPGSTGRTAWSGSVPGSAPSTPSTSAGTSAGAASDGARIIALRAEDATLVRDFLVRRAEMELTPRRQLARRLAEYLARRYGLEAALGQHPGQGGDEAFLAGLVSTPG